MSEYHKPLWMIEELIEDIRNKSETGQEDESQ